MNEHRDCVVRALSLAFNRAYQDVHAICAAAGRKPGRGMYANQIDDALKALTGDPKAKAVWTWEYMSAKRPTFAQFAKENPVGHFVVSKRGHMVALIDGVYHDAHPSGCGARCRVIRHYRIK
jgi:hypothetical protein